MYTYTCIYTSLHVYIYTSIHVSVCVCIYIYIERERERDRYMYVHTCGGLKRNVMRVDVRPASASLHAFSTCEDKP